MVLLKMQAPMIQKHFLLFLLVTKLIKRKTEKYLLRRQKHGVKRITIWLILKLLQKKVYL